MTQTNRWATVTMGVDGMVRLSRSFDNHYLSREQAKTLLADLSVVLPGCGQKTTVEERENLTRLSSVCTRLPWRWWTSNSYRRLSSDQTHKDGDVAYAAPSADGTADIVVDPIDQEYIVAACNLAPKLLEDLAVQTAWVAAMVQSREEIVSGWARVIVAAVDLIKGMDSGSKQQEDLENALKTCGFLTDDHKPTPTLTCLRTMVEQQKTSGESFARGWVWKE